MIEADLRRFYGLTPQELETCGWRHLRLLINALYANEQSLYSTAYYLDEQETSGPTGWKPPGEVPETLEEQEKVIARFLG